MIALFNFCGAFATSKGYVLAAASVLEHELTRATILVNIALYIGVYMALPVPYIVKPFVKG